MPRPKQSRGRGAAREIDGNAVLYPYLQYYLRSDDVWLFQMLTAKLILSLGVWFHPHDYARFPYLCRFAVRDVSYRGSGGREERWGSPTEDALFADDNSLIKGIPKRLSIQSPPKHPYSGGRLAKGFVAAHIWGRPDQALTYSFLPNVVWLPAPVAKLTDRVDSFAQRYVQAVSSKLYRDQDVPDKLRPLVEEAWHELPRPAGIPDEGVPAENELRARLNFFETDDRFFQARAQSLKTVVETLRDLEEGQASRHDKTISKRYGAGLPGVEPTARRGLLRQLERYLDAVEAGTPL